MKKYIISLIVMLTVALQANAISLGTARQEALYLTDKMAYELDLTPYQYDAVYEINLDYLTSINYYEPYALAWEHRNQDLRFVLSTYQYDRYIALEYFYRPVYWQNGEWVYRIYSRYSNRSHFYFNRPSVYVTYSGGHSWRNNNNRSWYQGRTYNYDNNGMRYHYDNRQSSGRSWRDGQRPTATNNHGTTDRNRNTSTQRNYGTTNRNGGSSTRSNGGTSWRSRSSSGSSTSSQNRSGNSSSQRRSNSNTQNNSSSQGSHSGTFGGRR